MGCNPQRSPSAGRGNEMHLTVEGPLFPLLPHPISDHEASHVVVRSLMHLVGPHFKHGDVGNLHFQNLQPLIQPRHFPDEVLQAAPCALGVLGQHLPHLIKAGFGVQLHETHLECRRRKRRRRWGSKRLDRRRHSGEPASNSGSHRRTHEAAEVVGRPRGELTGQARNERFHDRPAPQRPKDLLDHWR